MAVNCTNSLKVYKRTLSSPVDAQSVYAGLAGSCKAYLMFPGDKGGTQTMIGFNPAIQIRSREGRTERIQKGRTEVLAGDPIQILKEMTDRYRSEPGGIAKAIGYFSYDMIRSLESIGQEKADDLGVYDTYFLFHSEFLIINENKEAAYYLLDYDHALSQAEADSLLNQRIEEIEALPQKENAEDFQFFGFVSDTGKADFIKSVETLKHHILEGDIFQAVLSHRLKSGYQGDPFDYFIKLCTYNQSAYRFYMDFGAYQIAGSSPERLVTVKENKILSNPIAGTRPRGKSPVLDDDLARELLEDEKERAEHYMLVDLARNDLGKISETSSVKVTRLMEIEKYVNVMHLVSDVEGTLDKQVHFLDAVPSCLPAGTVSGAPKIRAMQLINDLETTRRGAYAGGIGYFTFDGTLDLALTIRTLVFSGGHAYLQAGAGIVHDSIPEKEWEETLHKASGLMEAVR